MEERARGKPIDPQIDAFSILMASTDGCVKRKIINPMSRNSGPQHLRNRSSQMNAPIMYNSYY